MVYKFLVPAALSALTFAPAALAQSDPGESTSWIAQCVLDGNQPPSARVTYAPARGIYCRYDNYVYPSAPGVQRTVEILQSDIEALLDAAEFTALLYQDWGLRQPDIELDDAPDGAPVSPGRDAGLVMQITPEIHDEDDPMSPPLGYFEQPEARELNGRILVAAGPDAWSGGEITHTLAHELFHAVHFGYLHYEASETAHWDEDWVAEGMADAMANAVVDLYRGPPIEVPPASAHAVPLSAIARLTNDRFTNFEGGLFTPNDSAAYDTSAFWTHLFAETLDDMGAIDAMLRSPPTPDDGASHIIDDWLQDDHARSLPEAYRDFLQEMIREGSYYDGTIEEDFLQCTTRQVTLREDGELRIWTDTRLNGPDIRENVRGMRARCDDYAFDASEGPITVSLQAIDGDSELSPHLQLFTGDAVLSEGETVTLRMGEVGSLRVMGFLNPITHVVEPDDLIQRPYILRFEQTPQSPCNEITMALNETNTPFSPFLIQAGRYGDRLPDWGSADVDARFGGVGVSGEACMRMVLIDYGDPAGPALTVQLAHNPTNAYWQNHNWASFNVHLEPGDFDVSDLRSGRSIVFEQFPSIDGYSDPFAPQQGLPFHPQGFASSAEHVFRSEFALGPLGQEQGAIGHHLNASLTLNFEDVGQRSARGTYSFRNFGPFHNGQDTSFRNIEAGGTFTIPLIRMGPIRDRERWWQDCMMAAHELRVFDAMLCARAHPDEFVSRRVSMELDLVHTWFFSNFLQ